MEEKKKIRPKNNELTVYFEYRDGKGKPKPGQQFLDYDHKVLRFYAKKERMPYVVQYYLADDTVCVLEVHDLNDGMAPFPVYIKRNPVPKQFKGVPQPGQVPPKMDTYKYSDLHVGPIYNGNSQE